MHFIRIIALIIAACLFSSCKTTTSLDAYQGLTDKQIFERAEKHIQKHSYEQAAKDLDALDTLYPFGQYSQQGQLEIINAYYQADDHDAALAAADRYIRLYPRADNVDYAYYMKGIINKGPAESWYEKWWHAAPAERDVTPQRDALESFGILIERYPSSRYTPEVHGYIAALRSEIAQHELEIAQYYLRRHAYVAAANRAASLVEEFPGTPQVAPALDVMVKSYHALNEPVMADRALQSPSALRTSNQHPVKSAR
jgi:outer membrane protein assembly factor BamD